MGKKKGNPFRGKKSQSREDDDDFGSEEINNDDLMFDGDYERSQHNRDEEALKKVKYGKYRDFEPDEETEILGVADSSDDDDLPKKNQKKKKKKAPQPQIKPHNSDLDSDIAEADDDGIPDSRAWGKKKSTYYSADYVDEDWGGMEGSDAEAAELEEQEAREIQKRMAETLDDADFGLEFFQPAEEVKKKEERETKTVIKKDVEKLSLKEKLDLLKKESPELLGLIDEYKSQIGILKDELQPLMKLIDDGSLPPSSGTEFVKLKFKLLLSYCTNLSFYFVLKSTRTPVKNHPVMKRLVQYKTLLKQLEPAEEKLRPALDKILDCLRKGENLALEKPKVQKRKTLKILSKPEVKPAVKPTEGPKVKKPELTADEKAAVELYKATRPKKDEETASSDEEFEDGEEKVEDEDASANEETEKRGITYQIAKNKGLMPTRSKEQRNPRVKHRNKFRKAKIRRKGAIREARTEVKRYGGEISGIKTTTVKSIKFK